MNRNILALLFASGSILPALAIATGNQSQQYDVCIQKSGGVNGEMSECIGQETKRQDAKLNKNYRALTATLMPERKKQLITAQRNWIAYRDANCAFYLDPDGGTQAIINSASCSMSMTSDRASELERIAQ